MVRFLSPSLFPSWPWIRDLIHDYLIVSNRLQNQTLKENVLFGSEYDEERYKKVIYQCALERDFSLFDAGDETEVGEKGLTLSGGQKARITLARAVYANAEVLLLYVSYLFFLAFFGGFVQTFLHMRLLFFMLVMTS